MKKKYKIAAAAGALLLVIAVVLVIVLSGRETEGNEQTEQTALTDALVVPTKYGELYYPDMWLDYFDTKETQTSDATKVLFTTKVDGTEYQLFEIGIGGGEGSEVGTYRCNDGESRPVYLNVFDLGDLSGLKKGDADRLYAMQESLNYVLEHLNK